MLDSIHWHDDAFPTIKAGVDETATAGEDEEDEDEEDLLDGEGTMVGTASKDKGKNRKRGIYADTGLQGVSGDEIVTGVSIRCGNVKDRSIVETVAAIEPVVAMQRYMQMVKLQQQYVEKRKTDPAMATEPPPVLPELPQAVCPESHPQYIQAVANDHGQPQTREMYVIGGRGGSQDVSLQMIARVGYVNIFPLLLKLLPLPSSSAASAHQNEKLESLLDLIESPELLWSPHGLRSIAKQDAFYQRRNSPGDAPYWRGPIWININYLALSALHHYKQQQPQLHPTAKRAASLYHQLRRNVLATVLGGYHRTGFFWEQYDDRTGNGISGHPFSGWTALVVNIMAETY